MASGELQMSSLPLRLSPPPVEATNSELLKHTSRECLSLEMPHPTTPTTSSVPKIALKRSPAEKDKALKDSPDANLNSTKVNISQHKTIYKYIIIKIVLILISI